MARVLSLVLVAYFLFYPGGTAYAYLDAGTGSMILQILLGGIAGAFVFVRMYWHRVKLLFSQRSRRESPGPSSRI